MMTKRKLRRSTRECNNPLRSAVRDDDNGDEPSSVPVEEKDMKKKEMTKRKLRRSTRECDNPFRSAVRDDDEPSSVPVVVEEEDMTKKKSLEVEESQQSIVQETETLDFKQEHDDAEQVDDLDSPAAPVLFREETTTTVSVDDLDSPAAPVLFREENGVEKKLERQVSADIKMKSVEEGQGNEEDTELTLGQERSESEHQQVRDEENFMDIAHPSERPVDEDGEQKMNELLTLRPCSSNKPEPLVIEVNDIDDDDDELDVDIDTFDIDENEDELDVDEDEDEEEEDEEDGGHEYSQRYRELSRMSSDKFQSMEPDGMPSMQPLENSHIEDFFPSGPQNNMSQMNVRSPSMYPRKGELSCKDDMQYHRPIEQNKRMRNDGQWNHRGSTMDMCMEQLTSVQYNIKSLYDEKEAQAMDAESNQQVLTGEVQSRDRKIKNLEKEVKERDTAIYKFDHEHRLMADLADGYRRALKDTRKAFAEYRERHPEPIEPLYMDVPGSGGLVVSVMAYEKMRLEQEEEDNTKRLIITNQIDEFERGWTEKLEVSLKKVHAIDERLFKVSEDVKLLKESAVQRNVPKSESEAAIFKEEEEENLTGTTMKLEVCVNAAVGASGFLDEYMSFKEPAGPGDATPVEESMSLQEPVGPGEAPPVEEYTSLQEPAGPGEATVMEYMSLHEPAGPAEATPVESCVSLQEPAGPAEAATPMESCVSLQEPAGPAEAATPMESCVSLQEPAGPAVATPMEQ